MTAILFLGFAVGFATGLFAWRRRASHATAAFVASTWSIAWWCLAEALVSVASPHSKALWADLKYLGIVVLPGAFAVMAARLAGRGRWVTVRLRLALCVVPAATLGLLFTNSRHQLFAVGDRADFGPSWERVWQPGPAFWAFTGYSYVLLLFALLLLARNVLARRGALSWQMATLVAGALVPVAANAHHLSRLAAGGSGRDPTPAALLATLGLVRIAMGRFRLLELLPPDSDAILSEVPDGLLVLDARDRVVDANRAAATMLGRARSDLVGETLAQVVPVDPAVLSAAGRAGVRVRVRPGEADERRLDVKIAGVRRAGVPHTRVVLLHDSTLRERAAEALSADRASATERWRVAARALEASEGRYEALFDVLPHPLFVYDPETLAIQALNQTARENYGYGPADEPPSHLSDLWPSEEAGTLRPTLAAGESGSLVARHRRRDGSLFEVEVTIRRVPFREGSGRLLLAVDLTERRRAEREANRLDEAIQTAARLWRGTVDALDSPLLVIDSLDRIVRLNRAAADALELDVHGALPRPLPDLRREPWSAVLKAAQVVRQKGAGASFDVDDPVSGRSWSVLGSLTALATPEEWVVVVVHETSRLVKLQADLRRQEGFALVGSVAAAVAHDVRNPLAILSVSLDALEIDFDGDPRLLQGLEPLRRSIARLTDLMQALLAYGSPAGQDWADVDVAELVRSLYAAQRGRAPDVGVGLELSLNAPTARVRGQPSRLLRVFENLLQNAVQFAAAGTRVHLEVERLDDDDGAWVRCRVRDHGPGFNEAEIPRVFEPFFSRRRGGTGLGMAIAQRIVDQHGGRIAAANAPGGGAVVTVDLPLARRSPAEPAAQTTGETTPP